MKPYEFEQLVCDHYRQKGYRVQTTSASNDYGIDVFAEKKGEKIAVQVKMYGGSTRPQPKPQEKRKDNIAHLAPIRRTCPSGKT